MTDKGSRGGKHDRDEQRDYERIEKSIRERDADGDGSAAHEIVREDRQIVQDELPPLPPADEDD